MCENIDWNVGRVLAKLAELKLADDTIVLYFSDNGPNSWRWNGGMKGRKASTDEGGVRSPLLIRWPGHIAAGHEDPADSGGDRPAADARRIGRRATRAGGGQTARWPKRGAAVAAGSEDESPKPRRLAGPHDLLALERRRERADAKVPARPTGHLHDMTADPGQTRNVAEGTSAKSPQSSPPRWRNGSETCCRV